jgi:hypothetical protein
MFCTFNNGNQLGQIIRVVMDQKPLEYLAHSLELIVSDRDFHVFEEQFQSKTAIVIDTRVGRVARHLMINLTIVRARNQAKRPKLLARMWLCKSEERLILHA